MHLPPPPEPCELLPPLLACLPTAFISPRPPPALLPLLSPVLRQRVSFLNSNGPRGADGWLSLLSWDSQRAAKLPAVVERMQIEPHPVSGELELDDVRAVKYRRLDEETLQSRIEVEQFDLLPVYVWCEQDEHAGQDAAGPGWKLAELRSLEDEQDGTDWYNTPSEASDAARSTSSWRSSGTASQPDGAGALASRAPRTHGGEGGEEDSDDDYWGMYDRSPGRTPAQKPSPAPANLATSVHQNQVYQQPGPGRDRTGAEAAYFARYAQEVQPALDSHDPDGAQYAEQLGQSSLPGDSLVTSQPLRHEANAFNQGGTGGGFDDSDPPAYAQRALYPADSAIGFSTSSQHKTSNEVNAEGLEQPRPLSPTSSHGSIEKLEEKARQMSEDGDGIGDGGGGGEASAVAQMAIKQHISTDIKSLFRLARSSGMERSEFERIVRTELDVLSLLEQDD